MIVKIDKIKITKRIRKLTPKINELAADIEKHGLINPITVMEVDGGYQLLAGLRRLRAVESLGWTEIEVTLLSPKDAEAMLNIEYSENVQRENFTFSEKMDYARLIEEIEKAKAEKRMLAGKTIEPTSPPLHGAEGRTKRETRMKVGKKIGMSGQQYSRAKYIANNASEDVINELDRNERTIRGTYDEIRSVDNKPDTISNNNVPQTAPESDRERAIRAERELDAMKYRQHNEIYHRDSIIQNLKIQIAELETALEAANKRIKELERNE